MCILKNFAILSKELTLKEIMSLMHLSTIQFSSNKKYKTLTNVKNNYTIQNINLSIVCTKEKIYILIKKKLFAYHLVGHLLPNISIRKSETIINFVCCCLTSNGCLFKLNNNFCFII